MHKGRGLFGACAVADILITFLATRARFASFLYTMFTTTLMTFALFLSFMGRSSFLGAFTFALFFFARESFLDGFTFLTENVTLF